jgi:nitroimidazol reductase NimA-like FMN-containing flavoprotein (pyridoxamine 5'-phosphate oxidase superfamily)
MRRVDREMPADFGRQVIQRAAYGVLALTDDQGLPYSLPLSAVLEGDSLYFHSAAEGTKNALIEEAEGGRPAQMVFVCDVKVPDLYSDEELDAFAAEGNLGAYTSKVFTTEFASAIVCGRVHVVTDEEEKRRALTLICQKYTPGKMKYVPMAIGHSLARTEVYRLDIENLTAKRKKYDADRKEMKWARME